MKLDYFRKTISTVIVVYGVGILFQQLFPTQVGSAIVLCVWCAVILGWTLYDALSFIDIKQNNSGVNTLITVLDMYFALVHVLAGVAFVILYLPDQSAPNPWLAGHPLGTLGYNLYVTYALLNTVTIFNSAGPANLVARGFYGSAWTILTTVCGYFFTGYVVALALWIFTVHREKKMATVVMPDFSTTTRLRQRNAGVSGGKLSRKKIMRIPSRTDQQN
jgi:hypothetical protein